MLKQIQTRLNRLFFWNRAPESFDYLLADTQKTETSGKKKYLIQMFFYFLISLSFFLSCLNIVYSLWKQHTANRLLKYGAELMQKEDRVTANACFDEALGQYPYSIRTHYLLGRVLLERYFSGDLTVQNRQTIEKAHQHLTKAINAERAFPVLFFVPKMKEDSMEAYFWRGRAALELGEYRKAAEDFSHVLRFTEEFQNKENNKNTDNKSNEEKKPNTKSSEYTANKTNNEKDFSQNQNKIMMSKCFELQQQSRLFRSIAFLGLENEGPAFLDYRNFLETQNVVFNSIEQRSEETSAIFQKVHFLLLPEEINRLIDFCSQKLAQEKIQSEPSLPSVCSCCYEDLYFLRAELEILRKNWTNALSDLNNISPSLQTQKNVLFQRQILEEILTTPEESFRKDWLGISLRKIVETDLFCEQMRQNKRSENRAAPQ